MAEKDSCVDDCIERERFKLSAEPDDLGLDLGLSFLRSLAFILT
jgi:hypothetical protein